MADTGLGSRRRGQGTGNTPTPEFSKTQSAFPSFKGRPLTANQIIEEEEAEAADKDLKMFNRVRLILEKLNLLEESCSK